MWCLTTPLDGGWRQCGAEAAWESKEWAASAMYLDDHCGILTLVSLARASMAVFDVGRCDGCRSKLKHQQAVKRHGSLRHQLLLTICAHLVMTNLHGRDD
jgi:hypothetical protein